MKQGLDEGWDDQVEMEAYRCLYGGLTRPGRSNRSTPERSRAESGTIFAITSVGSIFKPFHFPFHLLSHCGTLLRGKWDDFGDNPPEYNIYTVPKLSHGGTVKRPIDGTSRDRVDLFGEVQVVVGDAVAVVGGGFDLGVSPAEFDVGVMVGRLGDLADLVDERKRFGKVPELELPFDLVVVKFPAIKRFERRVYFFFGQFASFHTLILAQEANLTQRSQRTQSFGLFWRTVRALRYNHSFTESNEMRSVLISLLLVSAVLAAACGAASEPKSPVETMKTYTKAVKAKDTTTMKLLLSADTIKMLEQEARSQNVVLDEVVKRETLFPESQKVFEFRNEKIEGDKATVEVKNSSGQWETWPFVFEDSQWKIDKKGYADRLMQDIQLQNDAAIDDIIKQNQISPDPLATPTPTPGGDN